MDIFFEPFQYLFMKRALVSCLCLSLASAPVGVFLILRRMSLMGDALSHSILPGAAIGYVIAGLSLVAMGIGGIISGLFVAVLSGIISRRTALKEDASFAGFFIIAVALGVLIISMRHNAVDLMHVLFGSALAVNKPALLLMGGISTFTLVTLSIIYRPLLIECFDSEYFSNIRGRGSIYHILFLILVVTNLVSGFQALGTLLALGIMMLPAISARFWARRIENIILCAVISAFFASYFGLLLAYFFNLPTGPSIVLVIGIFYIFSLTFGRHGALIKWGKR